MIENSKNPANTTKEKLILPGERLDKLYWRGLKLIQHPQYFCMALDPILLADFVSIGPRDKVVDLGAGNGAISLLLWAKEPQAQFIALELMPKVADLARRNIVYNQQEQELPLNIHIQEGDIKIASHTLGKGSYSLVVSNPPYAKAGCGKISPIPELAAARTEIHCALEDVIREAAELLNSQGKFAIVHRPARLAETMVLMSKYQLEPKRLRLVQPEQGKAPNMFLLEAEKKGKCGLKILPTLVLQEQGKYGGEVEKIFAKAVEEADEN